MRERLEKDGFCIGEKCKSMGRAFGNPIFITTDSVLLDYHELMRKTFSEREMQFSSKIYEDMKRGWEQLERISKSVPEADPKVCAAGLRRARIVCGTMISLLDTAWKINDPDLARVISDEVKRITNAKEQTKPDWLGPSEPTFTAIDYGTCKPTGPLAESEGGCQYFRPIRFLQMIPFRLSRREELFSACYLISALSDDKGSCTPDSLAYFYSGIGAPAITYVGHALNFQVNNKDKPHTPSSVTNLSIG